MWKTLLLLIALACAFVSAATAQVPDTEHTLKLAEGQQRPSASIEDMAWLAGHWKGEAFGGTAEESWTPPSAGTMLGTFKHMHDGAPTMYELELITEEEGSLVFKVKHFNPDFSAWEEKSEHTSFHLVKISEDAAYFEGLTIERVNHDELRMYLVMSHEEERTENMLSFRRVASKSSPE